MSSDDPEVYGEGSGSTAEARKKAEEVWLFFLFHACGPGSVPFSISRPAEPSPAVLCGSGSDCHSATRLSVGHKL